MPGPPVGAWESVGGHASSQSTDSDHDAKRASVTVLEESQVRPRPRVRGTGSANTLGILTAGTGGFAHVRLALGPEVRTPAIVNYDVLALAAADLSKEPRSTTSCDSTSG